LACDADTSSHPSDRATRATSQADAETAMLLPAAPHRTADRSSASYCRCGYWIHESAVLPTALHPAGIGTAPPPARTRGQLRHGILKRTSFLGFNARSVIR